MKFRTMAWFVAGAVTVASSGIGAVACSSDSGSGNPTTTPEKDATTAKDTGSTADTSTGGNSDTGTNPGDDDSSTPGSDSSAPGDDAGADCGSTPTLHVSDGGKIFCPFGEGGAPHDCPSGGTCCLPNSVNGTFPDSVCNPSGGCTGKTIACEATEDCLGGGKVCCYSGGQPKLVQGCGYLKATNLNYTRCEQDTCATTDAGAELKVCTRDDECATGTHCVPFKTTGLQLGICQ